jgi:ABC-type sulfate/molybdate transport systems ATPase subunit
LLADEPTGNLDTRTSFEVLALLQSLVKDHDLTIVLVTHEAEIAECATRVVSVREWRIASDRRNPKPRDAAASGGRARARGDQQPQRVSAQRELLSQRSSSLQCVPSGQSRSSRHSRQRLRRVSQRRSSPSRQSPSSKHSMQTSSRTDRESDVAVRILRALDADAPRFFTQVAAAAFAVVVVRARPAARMRERVACSAVAVVVVAALDATSGRVVAEHRRERAVAVAGAAQTGIFERERIQHP